MASDAPDETPSAAGTSASPSAQDSTAGHPSRNLALVAMLFAVAMTFIDQTARWSLGLH